MTRWLALVAVVVGACKKDDPIGTLEAATVVTGSAVVVTATCTNFYSIAAADQGAFADCKDGKVRLEVPVDKLGKGKQTLHVRASNEYGRTMAVADLAVDLSVTGQPPYFRITGCDGSGTHLEVKVGDRTEGCETFAGASAKLVIEANPKAKLTIAGQTETVPESGKVTRVVDLTEPVLGLRLADVAVDPKDSLKRNPRASIAVPYALESDGKTLAGKLEFTEVVGSEGGLASGYLARVAASNAERGTVAAAKPLDHHTAGWIRYDGKLRVTDRSGAVRDVDLIAVEHESGRTENGTCDYVADGQQIRAKRILVDIELSVFHIADGTVEKKQFFAASAPNCPMFSALNRKDPKAEARVPDELIVAWLESL